MSKFIVALDGSSFAEQSLPHARGQLQPGDELVLMRVRESPSQSLPEVAEYLAKMVRRMRDLCPGVSVHSLVAMGASRDEITAAAAEHKADLLFLASHGRSGLKRWLLGSVAETVAREAVCPVWLVRCKPPLEFELGGSWSEAPPVLKRILVPMDGSGLAERALKFVRESLRPRPERLLLVHATTSQEAGAAQRYLASQAEPLQELGWDVHWSLHEDDAAHSILEAAVADRSDLVVMSTHGLGGGRRWWLGSVAERILRHSPCPLVLLNVRSGCPSDG